MIVLYPVLWWHGSWSIITNAEINIYIKSHIKCRTINQYQRQPGDSHAMYVCFVCTLDIIYLLWCSKVTWNKRLQIFHNTKWAYINIYWAHTCTWKHLSIKLSMYAYCSCSLYFYYKMYIYILNPERSIYSFNDCIYIYIYISLNHKFLNLSLGICMFIYIIILLL